MPDLFSAATTDVSSPNLGTCAGRFSWTLNSDQIALIFEGTDTLPATACYDFAEALASGGIDAEIPNVRYPSGGSVAVKVTLR